MFNLQCAELKWCKAFDNPIDFTPFCCDMYVIFVVMLTFEAFRYAQIQPF